MPSWGVAACKTVGIAVTGEVGVDEVSVFAGAHPCLYEYFQDNHDAWVQECTSVSNAFIDIVMIRNWLAVLCFGECSPGNMVIYPYTILTQ